LFYPYSKFFDKPGLRYLYSKLSIFSIEYRIFLRNYLQEKYSIKSYKNMLTEVSMYPADFLPFFLKQIRYNIDKLE